MKLDGHQKITIDAIKLYLNSHDRKKFFTNKNFIKILKCSNLCKLPIVTYEDEHNSNEIDNFDAFMEFGYQFLPGNSEKKRRSIENAKTLPMMVSYVDISLGTAPTHLTGYGQKYHFMRRAGECDITAYNSSVKFIEEEIKKFIKNGREEIKNKGRKLSVVNYGNDTGKPLALALHCFQDSFSLGHTIRTFKEVNDSNLSSFKCNADNSVGQIISAPPIKKIFVYSKQDKDSHSKSDYNCASPSNMRKMCVVGSKDLISLAINSLAKDDIFNHGWKKFKAKWLKEKLPRRSGVMHVVGHFIESIRY